MWILIRSKAYSNKLRSAENASSIQLAGHRWKKLYPYTQRTKSRKHVGPGTVPAWAPIDRKLVLQPHSTFFHNECLNKYSPCFYGNKEGLCHSKWLKRWHFPATKYRPISMNNPFSKTNRNSLVPKGILNNQIGKTTCIRWVWLP